MKSEEVTIEDHVWMQFGLGRDRARYRALVDDERIASPSPQAMTDRKSLAAEKLGAMVYSFAFVPETVGCTWVLQECYRSRDEACSIEPKDAFGKDYLGVHSFAKVRLEEVQAYSGRSSTLEHLATVNGRQRCSEYASSVHRRRGFSPCAG